MRRLTPWLLLLPFLILIGIFLLSILNILLQSLGWVPALGLYDITLKYFSEVLRDKALMESVLYSLWIAGVSSVLSAVLGVLLCYGVLRLKKSRSSFVGLMRMPVLIPHTVVAIFVITLFSQTGFFSRILYGLGFIDNPDLFPSLLYGSGGTGVILAYLWKEIPFVCYFVMALMGSVSAHTEQAALSLGASPRRAFLNVTLPLCMPAVKNAFCIIFTFAFGAYELPFLLGSTVPRALPVQAYTEYTHPDLQHRPYAMVLNMLLVIFCLTVCFIYYKKGEKNT